MPLEKELAYFEKIKEDLLTKYEGKFALIKGEEFFGAFDSAANAYKEGIGRFGKEAFMVKQVTKTEEVYRNQALTLGIMNARL